LLISLVIHPTA